MPPAGRATRTAAKERTAMVVAMDFGTTYSGACCGLSGARGRSQTPSLDIIRGWPAINASNRDMQKVPTRIYYGENDEVRWGYDIPIGVKPVEWVKLLLLDKADLPDYLQNSTHLQEAQAMLDRLGKDATTVTADYLRPFWNHILKKLDSIRGAGLMESTPIRVVLTIPAIWTENARNRMRIAAERAGILDDRISGETTLKFVSEPEAAAISVLHSEIGGRPDVKKGTKFNITDLGGGTADSISYEVVKATKYNIKVKECTVGSGGLYGATFLDRDFRDHFVKIIGRLSWERLSEAQQKKLMDWDWEIGIKRTFDGTNRAWLMEMPNDGHVGLDKDEISRVFDTSVVGNIIRLVEDQIKGIADSTQAGSDQTSPKFVILVGGFGRCPYVHMSLQNALGEDIPVLQPQGSRPWSAVVRGACLSEILQTSLLNPILQRKARAYYGWIISEPWDPEKHEEGVDEKEFDELRGEWMALKQFVWVVSVGDDFGSDPVRKPYSLAFAMDQSGPVEYHAEIWKTTNPDPPSRLEAEDKSVRKVGGMELRFPELIENLKTRHNAQRQPYRALEYMANGVISGNAIDFCAMYKGEKVGEMDLNLDVAEASGNADEDLVLD
ncbi:hypothetical protein PG993_014884 [Apiospora rasikravindrae]|uniref:Actin-like ATPase domain-containing protein n=1 Tax=Apiospora rasikravindrae TaxID=990691 RepID=A0ABR1RP01_9PEZI